MVERHTKIIHNLPPRPLSETGYHYSVADEAMADLMSHETTYAQDDIDMTDAGPSTVPARNKTTFYDD